ncbi:MAG: nucleotide exchange factor GrpE [Deinococcales bacterium]
MNYGFDDERRHDGDAAPTAEPGSGTEAPGAGMSAVEEAAGAERKRAPGNGDAEGESAGTPAVAVAGTALADDEVDILRSELRRMQDELEEARREAAESRDRYLRSRAELENYRKRVADDVERAREAGLDSAVLTVLTVFDDLGRALEAAESSDDPGNIVRGVRAVKESLERNLEGLDIRAIGQPGEPFDPTQHEALTAVPLQEGAEPGTIANVYQAGFKRGERLVRPARVVVYKEPE